MLVIINFLDGNFITQQCETAGYQSSEFAVLFYQSPNLGSVENHGLH